MHELIYTSAPEGIIQGRSGFTTVAVNKGFPKNRIESVERISGYNFLFPTDGERGDDNPANCEFQHLKFGGSVLKIVSKIENTDADYTGRSNLLAHHYILEDDDNVLTGKSPALALLDDRNFAKWGSKKPEELPQKSRLEMADYDVSGCRAWKELAGDERWGKVVAAIFRKKQKSVIIEFEPSATSHRDILKLIAEASQYLSQKEILDFTFSTYCYQASRDNTLFWQSYVSGSPLISIIKRLKRGVVITLGKNNEIPADLLALTVEKAPVKPVAATTPQPKAVVQTTPTETNFAAQVAPTQRPQPTPRPAPTAPVTKNSSAIIFKSVIICCAVLAVAAVIVAMYMTGAFNSGNDGASDSSSISQEIPQLTKDMEKNKTTDGDVSKEQNKETAKNGDNAKQPKAEQPIVETTPKPAPQSPKPAPKPPKPEIDWLDFYCKLNDRKGWKTLEIELPKNLPQPTKIKIHLKKFGDFKTEAVFKQGNSQLKSWDDLLEQNDTNIKIYKPQQLGLDPWQKSEEVCCNIQIDNNRLMINGNDFAASNIESITFYDKNKDEYKFTNRLSEEQLKDIKKKYECNVTGFDGEGNVLIKVTYNGGNDFVIPEKFDIQISINDETAIGKVDCDKVNIGSLNEIFEKLKNFETQFDNVEKIKPKDSKKVIINWEKCEKEEWFKEPALDEEIKDKDNNGKEIDKKISRREFIQKSLPINADDKDAEKKIEKFFNEFKKFLKDDRDIKGKILKYSGKVSEYKSRKSKYNNQRNKLEKTMENELKNYACFHTSKNLGEIRISELQRVARTWYKRNMKVEICIKEEE